MYVCMMDMGWWFCFASAPRGGRGGCSGDLVQSHTQTMMIWKANAARLHSPNGHGRPRRSVRQEQEHIWTPHTVPMPCTTVVEVVAGRHARDAGAAPMRSGTHTAMEDTRYIAGPVEGVDQA